VTYLLDTHAALWLLEGNTKLGRRAIEAIKSSEPGEVAICDLTLLEIAMLAKKKSISLQPGTEDVLDRIAAAFVVISICPRIANDAVSVALPHRDPFDRVITATAKVHDLTLITKDRRIVRSRVVPTLW
jgi:PIN domain nuclease of toxin-antitoxin system